MIYCPFAKEECAPNCGLYDEQCEKCALLLLARASMKNAKATESASSHLNNIAIDIHDFAG